MNKSYGVLFILFLQRKSICNAHCFLILVDIPNENVEDERDEEANPGLCSIVKHRAGVRTGFGLCSLQLNAESICDVKS